MPLPVRSRLVIASAGLLTCSLLSPVSALARTRRAAHTRTHRQSALRGRRGRIASRSLMTQQTVGRLGKVIQDNSPIYSNPGSKPLYSIIPSETYLVLVGQRDDYYAVLMVDGRYGWIAKPRVELLNYDVVSGKTGVPEVDFGNQIVQDAFKYLGLPYVWGGYSTSGTDCSGFIKAVFAQNGIALPRTAREQALVGHEVSTTELQPGDRVYFSFKRQYIDHTGLYIGNGYFIHNAISNGHVAVDLLTNPRYWSKLVRCVR